MSGSDPIVARGRPVVAGGRPFIVGILNVTPDSFSDGGAYRTSAEAVAAGMRMAEEGADLIDVGGESTRPGSRPVSPKEQIRRTRTVIAKLARRFGPEGPALSIDTRSAAVAEAALDAGAVIINDISALRNDPAIAPLATALRAGVVLLHMQGTPKTMQVNPAYGDVVAEVATFLAKRLQFAVAAGIPRERVILDPGIGFGKTAEHNVALLRHADAFRRLGQPVMVGPSRKRFLGEITGVQNPRERLFGTLGAVAACVLAGVELIRVHDVAACRQVADVCAAIARA